MSRERDRAVYIISVAAELAGVHPQTLRIYERKGLVDPARTPGGSRRYSDEDIALLRRIQELTNEGLNLAGVQRVLALEAEVRVLREQLRQLRADMEELLRRTRSAPLHDLVSSSTSVVLLRDAHRLPDV
jgi:MerR family transcriptional regulator/heat shock protein HspR